MSIQTWPDWIAPNSIDWWLEAQSRSGGQSILGAERIVTSPSARWRCTMTFRIWGTQTDPGRLLTWRTLSGALYGRSGSILIGPFDRMTPGRLPDGGADTTFSDGETFSDGSEFTQPAGVCLVASAALQGARALNVTYAGVGAPQSGQYFGLGGNALYLASSVVANSDGTLSLTFSPGLRAAAAIGDAVDFERPKATMRLMADDGARAKLAIGGVADTTLDLVEAF